MLIYNMESQWRMASGSGGTHIVEINQPPFDTFAVVSLTKTRRGDGPGAGGYCGIVKCNGDDLFDLLGEYPPAHFRRQMTSISFGIVSEGQYAEGMITLFRET